MKFILILSFVISNNAHAVYKKILEGYKNSDRLKSISYEKSLNELDFMINKKKKSWYLGTTYNNSNSYLEALLSTSSQKTLAQSLNVSLERETFKYGTLSLSHQETKYDISAWENSSLNSFSDEVIYESKNVLSYSYDFINKSNQVDWKKILKEDKLNKVEYKQRHESDYLDFFNAYLDAKQKVLLKRLYKDFEKRAYARVKQVNQRVKDGLSRPIELDQAKINLYNQQETILNNESLLIEKVSVIEEIIKYQFSESDYSQLNWKYKGPKVFEFIYVINQELELDRLKTLNELNIINLNKVKYDNGQSLSLNLSYSKNSFDEARDKSLSNSWRDGVHDEKIISLNYSIPLGESSYKYQKKKLLELSNKTKLDLKNKKGELFVKRRVLRDNINRFNGGVELLNKKVSVAKSSLSRHQNLYKKGQVSFEELLRSEEALISAQINKLNMLWQYETSLASLAFLNGNITKFLNNYTD